MSLLMIGSLSYSCCYLSMQFTRPSNDSASFLHSCCIDYQATNLIHTLSFRIIKNSQNNLDLWLHTFLKKINLEVIHYQVHLTFYLIALTTINYCTLGLDSKSSVSHTCLSAFYRQSSNKGRLGAISPHSPLQLNCHNLPYI